MWPASPSLRAPRPGPALLLACAAFVALAGCSRNYVVGERGRQAYYQTGHPLRDTSQELERIFRSVKRLQVTAYYRTYRFAAEDSITEAEIRLQTTFRRAVEQFTFDHSRSGTATVISRSGRYVSLITNEHVTRVPDTIVVFYGGPATGGPAPATQFVESVSIRENQRNLVVGFAETERFRVVARDSAADIAVIGVDLTGEAAGDIPILAVPRGDPARLAWGSFVYVLGYPRGFRMVTRAIVSDPRRDRNNGFLLDGLFNRGISGGLVLAVRGDNEQLEWIGMAMASSAQHEFILAPEQSRIEEAGVLMPYDGSLQIERVLRIDYGITFSVPMTAIERFMSRSGFWSPRSGSSGGDGA